MENLVLLHFAPKIGCIFWQWPFKGIVESLRGSCLVFNTFFHALSCLFLLNVQYGRVDLGDLCNSFSTIVILCSEALSSYSYSYNSKRSILVLILSHCSPCSCCTVLYRLYPSLLYDSFSSLYSRCCTLYNSFSLDFIPLCSKTYSRPYSLSALLSFSFLFRLWSTIVLIFIPIPSLIDFGGIQRGL
jgi:hypothetical protein